MSSSLTDRDRQLYPNLSGNVSDALQADECSLLPMGYTPQSIDLFCNDAGEPSASVLDGTITHSSITPKGWTPDAIELQLDGRPALVAIGDRVILNRLGRLTSSTWPIHRDLTALIQGWIHG